MASPVVMLSDFGSGDYGIPAMKGVCKKVDPSIPIFDLCHDISPMNVEEAAQMIARSVSAWPENTVFMSAVDPGYVPGRAVCAYRLKSGSAIVAPVSETFDRIIKAELEVIGTEDVTGDSAAYAAVEGPGALHGRDLAYCAAIQARK